ncbi:MAG: hypothetical protein PUG70_00885 [Lachnospiraceae bacterium]|nr:hypothetical protein [Lachnospiraceae bacterium]MDY5521654.1 hypothetical protein [Agathobacter sp.]
MIRIKCEVLDFSFEDHISIIGNSDGLLFDSGTYKSFLYQSLYDQQKLNKLESNCNVHFIDSPYVLSGIELKSSDCIVIDEANFAPEGLNELMQSVRKGNAYLIAIGRIYVKQFEYSVDSIYTFEMKNGMFAMHKYFENAIVQKNICDVVVCEDSSVVAALYSKVINDDVVSANGRSNFYRNIKQSNNAFLIADKPKFGQELLYLIYRIKNSNSCVKKLLLFLPSCFEEIICEVARLTSFDYECSNSFDLEMYYEKIACEKLGWDKRKVAKSFFLLETKYDFLSSKILKDLQLFYSNMPVQEEKYYYEIAIDDVNLFDLNKFMDGVNNNECNVGLACGDSIESEKPRMIEL